MDRADAIRIAEKWSQGHVCTLRDGDAEEYHKLCLAALREQEQSKWISVKERLPELGVPVLVAYHNFIDGELQGDGVAAQLYGPACWYWWDGSKEDSDEEVRVEITHWMPLPEPPKEGAEE